MTSPQRACCESLFWRHSRAQGLPSAQGWNPRPLQCGYRVLTTGPPGSPRKPLILCWKWKRSCDDVLLLHGLYSLPGSSVHGILQARILEWVAISFSRRSSQHRDWIQVFCIAGRHFTVWAIRESSVRDRQKNTGSTTESEMKLRLNLYSVDKTETLTERIIMSTVTGRQ